jgi:hypothetical protein
LLGNYYAYASTVLNKPDQEALIDTVWVETEQASRKQLTCTDSYDYPPSLISSQLLLHLKRKEDIQYFIQQYGRNAVRYIWRFVPSSPMFYRYSLVNATTSTRVQNGREMNLSITPNPSAEIARIILSLSTSSPVRLTLHDALGREVRGIAESMYAAGAQEFSVSLEGLPSGIYFVRANVGGQVLVRRLVVVR